jgi:hypothetical protein
MEKQASYKMINKVLLSIQLVRSRFVNRNTFSNKLPVNFKSASLLSQVVLDGASLKGENQNKTASKIAQENIPLIIDNELDHAPFQGALGARSAFSSRSAARHTLSENES